jgi:hypothetical protein
VVDCVVIVVILLVVIAGMSGAIVFQRGGEKLCHKNQSVPQRLKPPYEQEHLRHG